jgi:hypothetical protein
MDMESSWSFSRKVLNFKKGRISETVWLFSDRLLYPEAWWCFNSEMSSHFRNTNEKRLWISGSILVSRLVRFMRKPRYLRMVMFIGNALFPWKRPIISEPEWIYIVPSRLARVLYSFSLRPESEVVGVSETYIRFHQFVSSSPRPLHLPKWENGRLRFSCPIPGSASPKCALW